MGKVIKGVWKNSRHAAQVGCCPQCGAAAFEQISYIEGVAMPVTFGDAGEPRYDDSCQRRVADGIVGGYRCLNCDASFTVIGSRVLPIDCVASVRDLAQLLGTLSGAAAEVLALSSPAGDLLLGGALARLSLAVRTAARYGLIEAPADLWK